MAALRTERVAQVLALRPSHPFYSLKRDSVREHATGRRNFLAASVVAGCGRGRWVSVRRLQQRELGVHGLQQFGAVNLARFPHREGGSELQRGIGSVAGRAAASPGLGQR